MPFFACLFSFVQFPIMKEENSGGILYNWIYGIVEEITMKEIVEFNNVSFRYEDKGPSVINDVSFTIEANKTTAIIGHNGSGKSTIAKLMNGLLAPESGDITIDGQLLTDETVWDIRREIGMVFQNPDNQFVGTTVQDDVAFGMENRGFPRELMVERIDESLKAVQMEAYKYQEPHRLSGGQKQRVAIAGVIALQPKVMILDEATVMLDPHGREEILHTINTLRQTEQLTLIMVTHDLEEIIQADHVIVLNQGEIWQEGTPVDILSQGDQLKKIGLDVPFTTQLAEQLQARDIPIHGNILTNDQLLKSLQSLKVDN